MIDPITQPRASNDVRTALVDVLTDITDAATGYQSMTEKAEPDLKPVVERLHALHMAHADALGGHLADMGGDPSNAGSAMALVHKSIAAFRDWTGTLDASALPAIANGEEALVQSYADALEAIPSELKVRAELVEQRSALQVQIAALKA